MMSPQSPASLRRKSRLQSEDGAVLCTISRVWLTADGHCELDAGKEVSDVPMAQSGDGWSAREAEQHVPSSSLGSGGGSSSRGCYWDRPEMRPSFIYFLLCRQSSALAPRTHGSTLARSGASDVHFLWVRLASTATTSCKQWRTTRLSALPGGRAGRHGVLLSSHSLVNPNSHPGEDNRKGRHC